MKLESLIVIKEMLEQKIAKAESMRKRTDQMLDEEYGKTDMTWQTPESKVNDQIKFLREQKRRQGRELYKLQNAYNDLMEHDWK